jgi:hypothetical protein
MKTLVIICFIAFAVLLSCSKTKNQRIETRPTLLEANPGNGGYSKSVAMVLMKDSIIAANQQLITSFFGKTADSIRSQSSRLHLVTPMDPDSTGFMEKLARGDSSKIMYDIARIACQQGYNAMLTVAIVDIQARKEKRGFWKWRRTNHFLTVSSAMELIDAVTAAKTLSLVKEDKLDISESDYTAFENGQYGNVNALEKALSDLAHEFGDRAATAIRELPWRSVVHSVEGNRIGLAAGLQSGLKVGDKFNVFEGRHTIASLEGGKFIAPGYLLGRIEVTEVREQSALAEITDDADIQVGDIAAPVQ